MLCTHTSAKLPLSLEVITLFSCYTQLSMNLLVFQNKFIGMKFTISERLKARKVFFIQNFSFYEQLKFHAHLI